MKIGIVGFDTSHSYVFPQKLRALAETDARYAALEFPLGWPGDPATAVHPEILESARKEMDALGVRAVDSLDALARECDGFLLENVNGDTHLAAAGHLLPSGKPVFIDKPLANTYADALAIQALAEQHGTPVWTASSLRFEPNLLDALERSVDIQGIDAYGPAAYFEKGRGIVYYGIHTAEIIFAAMGPGIETVQTLWHEDGEVVAGRWKDGRMAVLRGGRKRVNAFGGVIHGEQSIAFSATGDFYAAMARRLGDFFLDGTCPVPMAESVEVIGFLDAAVCSREAGGRPIGVREALEQ